MIGASSGNADNLAKLVRRIFSDAIDRASNPNDVYEPRTYLLNFILKITTQINTDKNFFQTNHVVCCHAAILEVPHFVLASMFVEIVARISFVVETEFDSLSPVVA